MYESSPGCGALRYAFSRQQATIVTTTFTKFIRSVAHPVMATALSHGVQKPEFTDLATRVTASFSAGTDSPSCASHGAPRMSVAAFVMPACMVMSGADVVVVVKVRENIGRGTT